VDNLDCQRGFSRKDFIMNYLLLAARVLLGVAFVVFGLNGFFGFIPIPEKSGVAHQFLEILFGKSHYGAVIKGLEVFGGALLIIGIFVPLGILILTPILVNITLFHVFLDKEPSGMIMAGVMCALMLYLIGAHWSYFRPFLSPGQSS